jgi:hypothetical protein
MRAIIGLALLCGALQAAAAERTYAVLSLIGDKLTIARVQMATGSRLDTNTKSVIDTPGGELDREMLFAVEDAIKAAQPGAKVVLLGASDPALYAAQAASVDGGVSALMPTLAGILRGANATHLVLVTKQKGEARVPLDDGTIGSGTLEGLGFYLDPERNLVNRATGERYQGFLAPYGYVRFSLVDLADSRTLRERKAELAVSVSSQKVVATWENLDAEQKVRYLKQIIRREARETVPALLAP